MQKKERKLLRRRKRKKDKEERQEEHQRRVSRKRLEAIRNAVGCYCKQLESELGPDLATCNWCVRRLVVERDAGPKTTAIKKAAPAQAGFSRSAFQNTIQTTAEKPVLKSGFDKSAWAPSDE